MLRNDSPEFEKFGECYFSEIFPGKIKAWKRHNLQTQNLAVPIGLIKIVFFDSRIPHVGISPSKQHNGLRVTLAFKLRVN